MTTLQRLGPVNGRDDCPVAWRAAETLTRGAFDAAVGGSARHLAGCSRVVLSCQDTRTFAIGLMGALAAGAEVVLPANDLPATIASLGGQVVDDSFLAEPRPWDQPLPADGRVLFHTSGSTGEPKLVSRSLAQLCAEVDGIQALWGRTCQGAPTLATVPHQHAYGLVFKVLWPLAAKRPFHASRHELWEELLADLPAKAVIVTGPAHLSRMGGLPPLPEGRRPALVLSAGAPLAVAAAEEAGQILGTPVTEIYGSSETGAVATRRRKDGLPDWTPLPGYRLTPSPDGLLRVDASAAAAELADRVEFNTQGGFRLLGRADRIVKIEGKRVSLDEVTRMLAACPEVAEAAALALPGPNPELAALVVPSSQGWEALARLGSYRLGRALRRSLADRLPPASTPRRWRFVAEMPSDPLGKRRLSDMAALFADRPRLPDIVSARADETGTIVLELVIPADLFWFQGHFPGQPLLPGVVQLDWVAHFARHRLGLDLPAATEFQVKFKATIEPGDHLDLRLRHDSAKRRLSFAYRRDGADCSSGSVVTP